MASRSLLAWTLVVLAAGCRLDVDAFSVSQDAGSLDGAIDAAVDSSLDDAGDVLVDSDRDVGRDAAADTTTAADSGVDADDGGADTADTTPLDAATCAEAGALACGSPPACAVTHDDPLHCATAGCGIACDATQYCQNGSCACRPGLVACGGTCVDVKGDELHCGGCAGAVCSASQHCAAGSCVGGACPSGRTKCGRSCWDVSGDPTHCGTGCSDAKACMADELCIGGACVRYAPALGCADTTGCDCTSTLGPGARACPPLTGSTDGIPVCVLGTFCPMSPWT